MDKLRDRRFLLFDGAFGTYYSRLTGVDRAFERANLDDRTTVLRIHREYLAAGAQALKTNTFAANTVALGCTPDAVADVIRAGFAVASEAAQPSGAAVFADIGPVPGDDEAAVAAEFRAIADTFLDCGAESFLLETFPECEQPVALARYIKERRPDAFVIVSLAVDQDGYSRKGLYFRDIAAALKAADAVDAYGFNCVCGPSHMAALVQKLVIGGDLVSVMPNSGYPANSGGRTVYVDNAAYFAQWLQRIHADGVRILGGCCGTTPEHIAAAARLLSGGLPAQAVTPAESARETPLPPSGNAFASALSAGRTVIAVELDPPADVNWDELDGAARTLSEAGADVITLADSPLARARADSILCAAKLQREVGVQTLPHIACRDRNLIGLRAALLGAAIEGIRNALVVTGDPVPQADRGEVKGVFSLNAYHLIRYIASMNQELLRGREIFIGAALNINAPNFDGELKRAEKKCADGANFFMTQPAFSDEAIANIKRARAALPDVKLLAGIMPLAGYRNAIFLNNEVVGISIPERMITAFLGKAPEENQAVSVALAMDIVDRIDGCCDGYYLMTPRRKYELIRRLVTQIRAL